MHLLNRSNHKLHGPMSVGLLVMFCLELFGTAACYHPVEISTSPEQQKKYAAADSAAKVSQKPKCANYVLYVENALPRAIEIYEVGHNDERLVTVAQIGFTEVPMTESTQQFVAVSRGEVMAAATNTDNRIGDRVALSRGCRPY